MLKTRFEKFNDLLVSEDFILLYNIKNINTLPVFDQGSISCAHPQFLSNQSSLLQSFCKLFLCCMNNIKKTRSNHSIAFLNIRENDIVGLKLSLRKKGLWQFLDKLLIFVLTKPSLNLHFPNVSSLKQYQQYSCKSNFTITSNRFLTIEIFPEIRNLETAASKLNRYFSSSRSSFFSGFSFLCLIKILYKKKDLQKSGIHCIGSKTNQTIQNFKKSKQLKTMKVRTSSVYTIKSVDQIKKVFVSAFQFPTV